MSDNKKEVKEINLLELFSVIGKGIKNGFLNILKVILFLVIFCVKRIHFILLFIVFGGIIGWLFFINTQLYYSSDLIAQPNGISSTEMVDYISDLTKLCKRGNTKGLAFLLQLPDSTTKKIKSIDVFHYIDLNRDNIGDFIDFFRKFDAKDTSRRIISNRFYLQVEVFDNKSFRDVKNGIFNYISNNPYLVKLNELRKKELIELIGQTKTEIGKLDSLQNVDYFMNNNRLESSSDNKLMFLSEKDKRMYYHDKLSLIQRKQSYEKELDLATAPITIIKDFTHLAVEENPRGEYVIKFGFWFGVVGYLILLAFLYKKQITEIIPSSLISKY
jgi:hypothetical protein